MILYSVRISRYVNDSNGLHQLPVGSIHRKGAVENGCLPQICDACHSNVKRSVSNINKSELWYVIGTVKVVKDKVGIPLGEFGVSKSMECDIFPFSAHVTNVSVRSQTDQPPVSSLIQQRRLKLFGHIAQAAASEDHLRALRADRPSWRRIVETAMLFDHATR